MRGLISLIALCGLAACSEVQPPLVATDIRVPAPVPGSSMGVAYLTLENGRDEPFIITRVESPELEAVAMHETLLVDGVSRMRKVSELHIPANGEVRFEPGGKHLMLRYSSTAPERITLRFHAGDELLLSVEAIPGGQD